MFVVPFLDPLPPGPIDHSRDWVYRLGVAVGNLGKAVNNIGGGGSTGTFSFADNVPLVMSSTTGAELVFRSATNSLTLANGATDLLGINVTTKLAAFAGSVEIASGAFLGFDGAAAANRIFYNLFTLENQWFSNNIQTLTLDASGDVTVNTGNLTISNGQKFFVGAGAYIRHTGSGPTGQIGFYGPAGFTGGFRDGGELIAVGIGAGSASPGAAAALPANPQTYWELTFNGFDYKVPLYNV